MKKHIIGIIVFSFIVGTSAFVAAFFYHTLKSEQPQDIDASNVYVMSEPYTHSCWKNYKTKSVSVNVSQAIFDSKTGELKTELFVQSKDSSFKNINVSLMFFIKDGDSTRYLATENLTNRNGEMKGSFDMSDAQNMKAIFGVNSSYQWLDDLESHENLYVVPEITLNAGNTYGKFTAAFDELNATPVTVAH